MKFSIKIVRVVNSNDIRVKQSFKLYIESFPLEERREIEQLSKMIDSVEEMFFNIIEVDGVNCGFVIYWDFEHFYYLEHFAIEPSCRGMGIGNRVLCWIEENLKGVRIMEVEPLGDEIARRRISLYEKAGYIVINKDYQQPCYKTDRIACNLWIMSNSSDLSNVDIDIILSRIVEDVYLNQRD